MGAGDQGRLHGGGDLGAESRSTEELSRQRREKGRSGPRGQHKQGVGWGGAGGGGWLPSWSSTQNPKLGMCNRWVVEVRDREREKDGEKQKETGWS